jgi:hypothetical protein
MIEGVTIAMLFQDMLRQDSIAVQRSPHFITKANLSNGIGADSVLAVLID